MQKQVLITGVAGLIGSHLAEALLAQDYYVVGVDNLITGKNKNLSTFITNPSFRLVELDITQSFDSLKQMLPESFELIFHLASPASPPWYQKYPRETYLANTVGTDNLLLLLMENNRNGRFVYASTSEVYGDPQEHPQKESYWGNVNPNGARSCYDESKRLGETICGVFARQHAIDTRISRIFNTYGPRLDPADGRIISNFINQALRGEKLTIYGNGEQTRSYCYVADLVAGLIKLATEPAAKNQTVNLGNPEEMTVTETARSVYRAVHQSSADPEIEFLPLPSDDPVRRRPDISLAHSLLGWQPTTPFTEGIAKTIEWFRAQT
ncbi:MAG TPA: NAD-dependent epimerase/dehydratase family protein [Candidatus Woesebacteria bacterium]|nr:NAD-dependent epimerase/dehydratase family protein [Candidatus Woesebacteria bacterium]